MASKIRPKIRVALVDHHPVVRSGLEALLARHAAIAVVSKASSIADAVIDEGPASPDVLILDAGSLRTEGREIHRRFPTAKVIVFGAGDPEEEMEAARGGFHGYLSQSSPPAEIVRAVETVYRSGLHLSPRAARAHDVAVGQSERVRGRFATLTQRERQVLMLVAEGFTSRDIARRLRLSVRTVESHREHLARKLDIHTVAGLTRFAVANGLVEVD